MAQRCHIANFRSIFLKIEILLDFLIFMGGRIFYGIKSAPWNKTTHYSIDVTPMGKGGMSPMGRPFYP